MTLARACLQCLAAARDTAARLDLEQCGGYCYECYLAMPPQDLPALRRGSLHTPVSEQVAPRAQGDSDA